MDGGFKIQVDGETARKRKSRDNGRNSHGIIFNKMYLVILYVVKIFYARSYI